MLRKLFLLSTVASLAAFPALAQEATQPTTITPPAQQTEPAQQAPSGDVTQQQPAADANAPADQNSTAAAEQPASPPPSDAVIPAQSADQVRAKTMIGMNVYDTNGDKVGEVKDILFDKDGKATGVVLSVGGVLGIGAKDVGLQWSQVDIQPDAEVAKIQYNKKQLEAAPDFKTQEAQKAESDAAQMQQQQSAPATTVPSTSGTQ
jgi:sporulation protein YlmC with PRC-barrel domain